MRKLTLIVTALLIASVLPAAPGLSDRPRDFDRNVHENISKDWYIDEDLYAHAGWWNGQGLTLNTTQANESAQNTVDNASGDPTGTDYAEEADNFASAAKGDSDRPDWIWLRHPLTAGSLWEIKVTTSGETAAALDVFKVYRDDNDDDWDNNDPRSYLTPACPHGLVTPLYPDDGESTGGYLIRLLRMVTTDHQVVADTDGSGSDEIRVTLDPDNAPDGYMIVVYPIAGTSGNSDVGTQQSHINYTVHATEDSKFIAVDDVEFRQKDTPYSTNTWLKNISDGNCGPQDIPLPPIPQLGGPAPELPPEVTPDDLFGSHL